MTLWQFTLVSPQTMVTSDHSSLLKSCEASNRDVMTSLMHEDVQWCCAVPPGVLLCCIRNVRDGIGRRRRRTCQTTPGQQLCTRLWPHDRDYDPWHRKVQSVSRTRSKLLLTYFACSSSDRLAREIELRLTTVHGDLRTAWAHNASSPLQKRY